MTLVTKAFLQRAGVLAIVVLGAIWPAHAHAAGTANTPVQTRDESNMFTPNNFINEFIGAQVVVGSFMSCLGIGVLVAAAVEAGERNDLLADVGGVEACDRGEVDPALCASYREEDQQVEDLTVSGAVVTGLGVTLLVAAVVAWATAGIVEDGLRVDAVASPEVSGIAVSGRF